MLPLACCACLDFTHQIHFCRCTVSPTPCSVYSQLRPTGGEEEGSELGMPASFHHSLGTGISPSTSSTMPPPPTSAVNLCDLDFKALVFHSHCSLWLSFLHNPFDKLRDHCEDAESTRRSSDRSGVAPGTAGHRTVTSHSTVCYTATRGNAAQHRGEPTCQPYYN